MRQLTRLPRTGYFGCIAVHSFAMQQEEKEKDTDESDCAYWDFIQEGLSEDDEAMRMQAPEPRL